MAEADSAEAALAQVARGTAHPDLLVADVTLPAMNGLALLDRLRRERPGLPAVLVSGYPEAPRPAGPQALHLGKSYRPAELVGLVAEALKNNLRTDD
jgi:CheY-like chemotaxis protein